MSCRICRRDRSRTRVGAYRYCRACGCLVLHPFPEAESNAAFVGDDVATRLEAEDRARVPYLRHHLARVERAWGRQPAGETLLEIGCGAGVLLQEASARGWRPAAVEMSPELAALAVRNNPEAQIVTGDVVAATELPTACSAVVALDVIEHVSDPAVMLKQCRRALAPGGVLLLQTPNTGSLRFRLQGERWDMLIPDQHLHLFSPQALADLVKQEGFLILEMTTASGSGRERGVARLAARIKERVLSALEWGNGLRVVARRAG